MIRGLLVCACVLAWSTGTFGEEAEPAEPDTTQAAEPDRSPRSAMIRSLILPGWGQFYNGKKLKGTLVAAAEVGSVVAFFVRRDQLEDEVRPVGAPPKRNVFLFTTIGVVFYSVVDAFVDAHLDDIDWGELEGDPESRTLGVRFKVAF